MCGRGGTTPARLMTALVGFGNFDAEEKQDIDGSYLGLPQLQPYPLVQHTAKDRRRGS